MKINTKQRQSNVETADVIDSFVRFRSDVRNFALEVKSKDKTLLEACDVARKSLALNGVQIKVRN